MENIDWSDEHIDEAYESNDIYPIRQLYIHPDIFDWFENLLISYTDLKYEFMEIGHHPTEFPSIYVEIENNESSSLEKLNEFVKLADCKLIWESQHKYFLPIGARFEQAKAEIKTKLMNINLWQYLIDTREFECNWFLYKKVQIYEFFKDLSEHQLDAIYNIFKTLDTVENERVPLYISDPMLWHTANYSYIYVHTLAMDICGEEWRRYNLLKDFDLYDILSLDLANKDFRDSYYDDYLDRYLNILIQTLHPHLSNEAKKIDYWVTTNHDKTVIGYFFYLFHSKIDTVHIKVAYEDELRKLVKYYSICEDETPYLDVNLKDGAPRPKEILEHPITHQRICFNISNYHYFNDHLFRQLIEIPSTVLKFVFDMNDEFHFNRMQNVKPLENFKKPVEIVIANCSRSNRVQLENFIRYLIEVFRNYSHELLYIWFSQCTSRIDYLCFENLGRSLTRILFCDMTITQVQLYILAACMTEKCILTISSCFGLNDSLIFEFLKRAKLSPNKLVIEGDGLCSILLYFQLAEYLMKLDNTNSCAVSRMPEVNDLRWQLNKLEFYRRPDKIILRDKITKWTVDWYLWLNHIKDEPFIFD